MSTPDQSSSFAAAGSPDAVFDPRCDVEVALLGAGTV
jgi:hypothetical protein